jgi:5,10-methylenetetrahydromethanopterin reductase
MDISCAFTTSLDSPEYAAVAEELGYKRAWFYDGPPVAPDVWMMLALAAKATSRIGLGPGILNPAFRHPMVNAAGTAVLTTLAPGRVAVGLGPGFAPRIHGQRPCSWSYVEEYVSAFRGLLRGEAVLWEGAKIRMLHAEGQGPPRPIDVPVVIAAMGPKGDAVARRHGDGLFTIAAVPPFAKDYEWVAVLCHGTVLDPDEDLQSDRVRAAAGPGTMTLAYHAAYRFGEAALSQLPGGDAWLAVIERHPDDERHLAVHEQHFTGLNEADQVAWQAGAASMAEHVTITGRPEQIGERLDQLAEQGVTEVVYQPAGPDIPGELERFLLAARDRAAGTPQTASV